MPVALHSQLSPPSWVTHTPPQETPTRIVFDERGSTQIEWMPGKSAPPPIHLLRPGLSHSGRFSSQLAPRSEERKSPPGRVPHHSTPGSSSPPASSAQINCVLQLTGFPQPSRSTSPSGLGG